MNENNQQKASGGLSTSEGRDENERPSEQRNAPAGDSARPEEPTTPQDRELPGPEGGTVVTVPIKISPDSGVYASSVTARLSCDTEGLVLRYTLDGSDPDASSPVYEEEEGLLLRASTTLKARAFKEGQGPGPIAHAEYQVRAPVWQENEPEDRSDAVEHAVAEEAGVGGWRIAGASVRGKLHAHRALWREDAFAFGSADEWTVLTVSDGAGSAPLSRVGAHLACEVAVGHLVKRLSGLPLSSESEEGLREDEMPRLLAALAGAAQAALRAIRNEAETRERPPEELSATLLVAIHRPWRGRHLVGTIQVGDGAVALLDWEGGLTLLGVPDHGEHSAETRFLTTQGVEGTFSNRVLFSIKERLRCVAAMTDGVSDDFFPEEKRLVELLLGQDLLGIKGRDGALVSGVMETVSRVSEPAAALLEWIRYEKRGSSDDRTLVLLWDEG